MLNPATTMALGDGNRNEGIWNARHAASQAIIKKTKAAVGARRSAQRPKTANPTSRRDAVSGDGPGEELAADMICEGMECWLRQRCDRAGTRQINIDDFPHAAGP